MKFCDGGLLLKPAYKIQVSLNLHKITDITIICLLLLLIGTQGMALKFKYSAVNVDGTGLLYSAGYRVLVNCVLQV
jgi:hypothetical protein